MLELIPISLSKANAFVTEHHRHYKPVVGNKFSIGCCDHDKSVNFWGTYLTNRKKNDIIFSQ